MAAVREESPRTVGGTGMPRYRVHEAFDKSRVFFLGKVVNVRE
jgi:hypothetical protein